MNPTRQQWLLLINEQKQSGLSIIAFCRNKNIKVDNFYYHRNKTLKKDKPPAFVLAQPVKPPLETNGKHSLKLQYGQSQLHIPADIPATWLASLIKALA